MITKQDDLTIRVKRTDTKYRNVTVQGQNTTIDLGILNEEECRDLAETLEVIVDELREW